MPLALWAAVGEADEDDLLDHVERAMAARLLAETPDGAGVRFAHALIREALYEGLPRRGGALHRRAAEALAAASPPDPDAVAYHFRRAGDPRAVDWLIRAGVRARHASRLADGGAERFAAAAALPDADGTRAGARGWLLFCRGMLLEFSG